MTKKDQAKEQAEEQAEATYNEALNAYKQARAAYNKAWAAYHRQLFPIADYKDCHKALHAKAEGKE